MEPLIHPLPRDKSSYASRRAIFERTRRQHAGTLNIFATTATNNNNGPVDATVPKIARQPHLNDESHETREFSWARLRRVTPPKHTDTIRGIRHVTSAAGNQQNIQVVGITDAYKDPHNMPRSRSGLRCVSRSHSSSSMWDIMSRSGNGGNVRSVRLPSSRGVHYSPQERFCQAVRDHAQHRRGGVTEFYVNLARGRVGRVAAETPVETPREWRLLDPPKTHTLTLGSCRDQLQSLTGISISLADFSKLLWGGKNDCDVSVGGSASANEEWLCKQVVPYRDFSAVFGDNAANNKLATLKI